MIEELMAATRAAEKHASDLRDERLNAALHMERFGGGFAEAIGLAFIRGDSTNSERVVQAFPELFEKYSLMYREWANQKFE